MKYFGIKFEGNNKYLGSMIIEASNLADLFLHLSGKITPVPLPEHANIIYIQEIPEQEFHSLKEQYERRN